MKHWMLIGCMLWLFLPTASAETIQAYVDRTRTQADTPVQLTISLPGRNGTVDTAGIRDFDVHSRGTSTQVQIINGVTREEQTHRYLLVAKRAGKLRVPALKVILDGKTYHTQPIEIRVTAADAGEVASGEQDIYVTARVSENALYIGRQFVYTFILRYGVQIANTQYTPPDFTGFTAKQIGAQQSQERVISGRRYNEVTLSYLLIPIKTGALTIEPAILRCDTVSRRRQSGGRDRFFNDPFFSDSFFGNRKLTPRIFKAPALTLQVRPLPPKTGTTAFSGLVGSFSMAAVVENKQVTVGDSITLSVTISGAGNIMDADAPVIQVPDAFKQYADTPESDIQLGADGYHGKKVFRLALVAVRPGSYQVSPAAVSFFDPEEGIYKPLSVSPIEVTVLASAVPREKAVVFSGGNEAGKLPGIIKKKVAFTGRDILPLKTGLDAVDGISPPAMLLFGAALLTPAMLYVLMLVALKFSKRNGNPAAVMAQKSMQTLTSAAKLTGGQHAAFLSRLYHALVYAACSKAETCSESLTYAEARQILREAGVSAQAADGLSDLMKRIDSARYSGRGMDGAARKELLLQTTRLIKEVLR